MNPFGKYRSLRDNAKSALLAAIEIYNKPQLQYRNECFTILLVNAWELAIKAQLSKQRVRIFYPKERDKPYMTLSLRDALDTVKPHFPANIPYRGVAANLESLIDFRNNAIHFYNEPGLDVLLYGLAQTSIVNFRDFFQECFDKDIAEEVNLSLMPLSFRAPPDPIDFIRRRSETNNKFLSAYLQLISETTQDLEKAGVDTGRQGPLIVQAGESMNVSGQLVDFAGDPILKAGLVAFLVTLFDEATETVINDVDQQDRLAEVAADGSFTLKLNGEDNAIVDLAGVSSGHVEKHILAMYWLWNDGSQDRSGIQLVRFRVQRLGVQVFPALP